MTAAVVCQWCRNAYREHRQGQPAGQYRCSMGHVLSHGDQVGTPRPCGDFEREPGSDDDRQ